MCNPQMERGYSQAFSSGLIARRPLRDQEMEAGEISRPRFCSCFGTWVTLKWPSNAGRAIGDEASFARLLLPKQLGRWDAPSQGFLSRLL